MYFAVLGKHKTISLAELQLVGPQELKVVGDIALFQPQRPEYLDRLGGIIKRGFLVNTDYLQDVDLIGTNSDALGMKMKKQSCVKRYKHIDLTKTDEEVKNKGIELIQIDAKNIGKVSSYQTISLYENIDFQKPVSGMQVGMLPSKLANILLNLGVAKYIEDKKTKNLGNLTVYDLFVGFGTVGMIANALGHDFIGSDINITSAKQNHKRWAQTNFAKKNRFTLYKHDVNDEFTKPFLKNVEVIVSEGWLGPVIKRNTKFNELQQNMQKIKAVYTNFITNVDKYWSDIALAITVPFYTTLKKSNTLAQELQEQLQKLGWQSEVLAQEYLRPNQAVGRQILIGLKKSKN